MVSDAKYCAKIPKLEVLPPPPPDLNLKGIVDSLVFSGSRCDYMKNIFAALKLYGYFSRNNIILEGNMLRASLNMSKQLNTYELLGGFFGNHLSESVVLPLNLQVKVLKYNCTQDSLTVITVANGKLSIFPNFLELSSVSLIITLTNTIDNPSVSLHVQGVWSIGDLQCTTIIDRSKVQQWQLEVECNSLQFNINSILAAMGITANDYFTNELSFKLNRINGTVLPGDENRCIMLQLEGVVSLGDLLSVRGCLGVYRDIRQVKPQLLLLSDCWSSNTDLNPKLSNVIQKLLGVKIDSIPYFGELRMPKMRLIIPPVDGIIPDLILREFYNFGNIPDIVGIARGITFVFKPTFGNVQLDIAMSTNINGKFLDFIPISGVTTLKVQNLLQTITANFIPPTLHGLFLNINPLDLNVKSFRLNPIQRRVHIVAAYNTRFSILQNSIVLENTVIDLTADLYTGHLQVALKGQFTVDDVVVHSQVDFNTEDNSYMLTATSPKLCLVHILTALKLNVPTLLRNTFHLHTLCITEAFFKFSSKSNILCFGGIVSLWSQSVNLYMCTDADNNVLVGFTLKKFSLSQLLSNFVGNLAKEIPLLNTILDIGVLYSDANRDSIPKLPGPTIPRIDQGEGGLLAGLTLTGTAGWPSSCGNDIFCSLLSFFLPDASKLRLPLDVHYSGKLKVSSLMVKAQLPDFSIGPVRLLSPALQIQLPTGLSIVNTPSLAVTANVNLLNLKFIASVQHRSTPPSVTLGLSTKQCWMMTPFLQTCNLLMSVIITPSPTPIPGFVFGADSKIGLPMCNRIKIKAIVGYNPSNVLENFFYGNTTSKLSLTSLLNAFCVDVSLPSIIGDTGFPNGFIASYSLVERYQLNVHIRKGFYFNSTMNIFGLIVQCLIQYVSPSQFYMRCQLPKQSIANGAITITGPDDNDHGASLEISIGSSVSLQASVLIKAFQISAQTVLSVVDNDLCASLGGSMYGRFQASIQICGAYASNTHSRPFTFSATLETDFFNFVTREVKNVVSGIQDGANAITVPLQATVSTAQTAFDKAASGIHSARSAVREAENKVLGARREVDRIKNKVNSVCSIRSCGSVSVGYPCGLSCSWRGGCHVKTCHKDITDPGCLSANGVCRGLKATWETLLRPAEEALRGFQTLLSRAQSDLRDTQSKFQSASTHLNDAKAELEKAKSRVGKDLNVVAAIQQLGINNIISIHSVSIKATQDEVATGTFSASVDMTVVNKRINAQLQLMLTNPSALIDYAVDYIKNSFVGRK
jgi:hypothetical protein